MWPRTSVQNVIEVLMVMQCCMQVVRSAPCSARSALLCTVVRRENEYEMMYHPTLKRKVILSLLTKGLFAINKPKNVTSAEALTQLKSILLKADIPTKFQPHTLKLGHGGTLDHTATGVLVVGVGWGCKILPLLLHSDKKYVVTGHLGVATETYNEVGKVTQEMKFDHITKQKLEDELEKYTGIVHQKPPKYSALKLHGRRLGDWIRDGVELEIKPRPVKCYNIKCTEFSPPKFTIEISCGGGFYVRSLIHDVGQGLSSCAHVTALHRTQHGPFTEDDVLEQSLWNGHNIMKAIIEAQEKYGTVLRKSNVKNITYKKKIPTAQFKTNLTQNIDV